MLHAVILSALAADACAGSRVQAVNSPLLAQEVVLTASISRPAGHAYPVVERSMRFAGGAELALPEGRKLYDDDVVPSCAEQIATANITTAMSLREGLTVGQTVGRWRRKGVEVPRAILDRVDPAWPALAVFESAYVEGHYALDPERRVLIHLFDAGC